MSYLQPPPAYRFHACLAEPVQAHDPGPIGERLVVGDEHPAFARGDGLGGVEGEADRPSDIVRHPTHWLSAIARRERVSRILHHGEAELARQRPRSLHVARRRPRSGPA